ncbi:hypothetical protein Tco_0308701 [Tanacetum coccineum]
MTLATSSSGLVPNPVPQQPFNPLTRNDWDRLFQPMFNEYFNPPSSVASPVPVAVAPRAVKIAATPLSTTIDQDAPSSSTSLTNQQQQSLVILQGVEEPIPNSHFDGPCHEPLYDVSTLQESLLNVQSSHSLLELIEPNKFKEAMLESSWIEEMQEEIQEIPTNLKKTIKFRNSIPTVSRSCNVDQIEVDVQNFKESFAPIARIKAIRILIANAATKNMKIY